MRHLETAPVQMLEVGDGCHSREDEAGGRCFRESKQVSL